MQSDEDTHRANNDYSTANRAMIHRIMLNLPQQDILDVAHPTPQDAPALQFPLLESVVSQNNSK